MLHFKAGSEDSVPVDGISQKIFNVIRVLMIVFTVLIIGVYIYGQYFLQADTFFDTRCDIYTGEWSYITPSGEKQTFTAPGTAQVNPEDTLSLTTTLPENIPDDTYFFLLIRNNFKVIIDGVERYDFQIMKSTLPGGSVKRIWLPIDLNSQDAGKEMTLVISTTNQHSTSLYTCYLGNIQGFVQVEFASNAFILLMAFSLIIFSSIITLVSIIIRIFRKKAFPLMYLSIGVLAVSFWLLLDNYTYGFMFANYYVDGVVEYMLAPLIPFSFISHVDLLQKRRYQKYFNIVYIILSVLFVTVSILHFSGAVDFIRTMTFMNIVLGISMLLAYLILAYDVFVKRNRDYMIISIGYTIFLVLVLCEIVHLNLRMHSNDGMFVAIGMLFVLLFSVIQEVISLRRLQETTLEATESNRAKSTFLANMSHEIRTPINAIMGMNELVLRENSSESIKEYSENIKSASQSLLDIINDILDFSKIEQGKMEIINENYDMRELLLSVMTMIKVKADEKGLRFDTNISEALPTVLCGDSKRIREIMINLLNNAVKYTHKGSISFTVKMSDNIEIPILIIRVKDTGIGIRDEDRNKLFKQFERLDFVKNKSIEGSGLGLAITSNLVSLMGGTIECNSSYGMGTEFIVTIPQIITDHAPIGNLDDYSLSNFAEDEASACDFVCPAAKILIVDDNDMNLRVASGLIETTKAVVTTCMSGFEMLDLITKEKYDIILLDHMMPDMDGIETLAAAQKIAINLNKDTPVIALTANAIVGAKEMYLQNGFTDYLSKPMDVAHLNQMLRTYLPQDKIIPINTSAFETQKVHNAYNSNVVDRDTGLRYCGGMEDFYMDALKLYSETLPDRVDTLNELMEKKDFVNYEVQVHTLKSNSLTIGATDLSAMAKELEFACKKNDIEFVENNHRRLIDMCNVVLEECRKMME